MEYHLTAALDEGEEGGIVVLFGGPSPAIQRQMLMVPESLAFVCASLPILKKQVCNPLREHESPIYFVVHTEEEADKAKVLIAIDVAARGLDAFSRDEPSTRLIFRAGLENRGETEILDTIVEKLGFASLTHEMSLLMSRTVASMRRDASSSLPSLLAIRNLKRERSDSLAEVCASSSSSCSASSSSSSSFLKDLPHPDIGLSVYEFFSGIGGMRLSLPSSVRGIPIRNITAFDCSDTANDVYDLNFHAASSSSSIAGELRRILIDGLKVADVDNRADIWTMSPPCQPSTTTRGAKRQDSKDNRSRGIFHLMSILRAMKQRPRWIFLENVKGFYQSDVWHSWQQTLIECGYSFKHYLLSPIDTVGCPNHRLRYYMAIEHSSMISTISSSSEDVLLELPATIRQRYPLDVRPLSDYVKSVQELGEERAQALWIDQKTLDAPWARSRLSIVGKHDKVTYCFTKSYGRLFDKSSGSCYLEDCPGPLADARFALDRTQSLSSLQGRLRLFDPEELLAIAGFPTNFEWPSSMPLTKRLQCIGNSINVTVVQGVMASLFE